MTNQKKSAAAIFAIGIAAVLALVALGPLKAASGNPADEPDDAPNRLPSAPQSFIITSIDGDSIDFSWEAPLDPGKPSALGYVVKDTSTGAVACGTKLKQCSFANPAPGKAYRFSLVAQNGFGSSPLAFVEGSFGAPPSAVRNLSAAASNNRIDLTWDAPKRLGTPPLRVYVVINSVDGREQCFSRETSCSITLEQNKTYEFVVFGRNAAGDGPHEKLNVNATSRPSIPRQFVAKPATDSVNLSWNAPENPGYPGNVTYIVRSLGEDNLGADGTVCEVTELTCNVEGLTPATEYRLDIVAANNTGTSDPVQVDFTTKAIAQASVPSVPRDFTAEAQADGVKLTWKESKDLGSPGVVRYIVTNPANSQTVCVSLETSCVAEDLTPGQYYNFDIVAQNDTGSSRSASASATPGALPSRPRAFNAQPVDGGVILTWNPPASVGMPALYDYLVINPSTDEQLCVTVELTCEVVGLVNGKNIGFNIVARNAIGSGPHAWVQAIPLKSDHSVVVRAKGEIAEETFMVSIGGTEIGRAATTGEYADYTFEAPAAFKGPVTVTFTNDLYNATTDRNLWIDWVKVNGTTFESEAPTTYSEGAWTSGMGCSPGFRANERITCGGTFTYTVLGAGGAESAPGDPNLPEEPAADEAASKHVVRVRAKGHIGGERFALRIGTEVIDHVVVTNQWRTYRFKLDELPSGKLVVGFMNDSDDGVNDFNLQVDWVKVDKEHHETEDARIYMAGPGPDGVCQSGHRQSETLYCAGAFFYADL